MEWKEDLKWPTNTLSKLSSDAACLTGVLRTDDPVECLNHVGATAALARVTTVAWPPCLGAGRGSCARRRRQPLSRSSRGPRGPPLFLVVYCPRALQGVRSSRMRSG